MRLMSVLGVGLVTLAAAGWVLAHGEAGQKSSKKGEPAGRKPVGGLVASAEVVEQKPPKGAPYLEVRFQLKNVTDRAITICDYVGNQPLKVRWIGPDGKTLRSDHYGWLRYVDLAGMFQKTIAELYDSPLTTHHAPLNSHPRCT